MDFKTLIDGLPMALTSPYAFTSYVFLIVAWVIIALRVNRYKMLLQHLKSLPAKDRLSALKLEVQDVHLKAGVSPEQWVRSRAHRYYFLAFIAACIVATIIAVTMLNQSYLNRADLDISLQPVEEEMSSDMLSLMVEGAGSGKLSYPSYDFRMSFMGLISDPKFDDLRVTYQTEQSDLLSIYATMPYLENLRSDGELVGFRYWNDPFQWSFPRLSLKMVNNTKNTIFLNKILIRVKRSSVNTEPIPVFRENFYNVGVMEVTNEGHGRLIDPELTFKVISAVDGISDLDYSVLPNTRKFTGGLDEIELPIRDLIDEELVSSLKEPVVCVMGVIKYRTESGDERRNTFKTRVSLAMPPPGAPAPPSFEYSVFLEAGKSGYIEEVPISQAIKPGEYDHFLLSVATDKSASFEFDIGVNSLSDFQFSKNGVRADLFVPKSAADDVRRDIERATRLNSPWGGAYVSVNELLEKYKEVRSVLTSAGIPVDQTFGTSSQGPLKKFIVSFGRKVSVERVLDVIAVLEPLGLEAIDVGEVDFHEADVYIGSFDYQGVALSADVLSALKRARANNDDWISFVEAKRTRLAEND